MTPRSSLARTPFSTDGMKFRGIDPPKILSTNSSPAPRAERLDLDPAVAELPPAARLLLVPALDLRPTLDGLLVGDPRRQEDDLGVELPLHPLEGDLDVLLADARDQELLGLGVVVVPERGILLGEPGERVRDLVLVALRLRLKGEGDGRLRELDAGQRDRRVLGAQRVPGERLPELQHHADLAGAQRVDGLVLPALEQRHLADPLARLARRVVGLGVAGDGAREDAEERQLADVGIGERLEDQRGEGLLRARAPA